MSKDIAPILADWEFDAEEMQVRLVTGLDGREKLQRRLDLGLFQMELDGRPDGTRPHGRESALDHFEALAEATSTDFVLDEAALGELMREGVQYYHRYTALFHLERFDLVARDTERNLRLFAFVVRHAADLRDRMQFDQYRPYVTMMRARALGLRALEHKDWRAAIERIDEGIGGIRAFLREYSQTASEVNCPELDFLARWRRQVERERTIGPVERLEEQLGHAVALEQFEEAARLRDQIHRLRGPKTPQSPAPDSGQSVP